MSKIDRVVPVGGLFGSTPGGGGSPSFSSTLTPYAVGVAVMFVDWRNGGFCALDDEVPPGVKFQKTPNPPRTMVFTSPMPGDGKSTSAANLAITLAQQGQRVLLVDADLRRGLLNNLFDLPRDPGLSNVLLAGTPIETAVRTVDLGAGGRFDFLGTGTLPPNPAELLGSEKMRVLIAALEQRYDAILFDSPPLNLVTDAALLGTACDGVVLVGRAGVTTATGLAYAIDQLRAVRAPVLGAVLNDVDFKRDMRYYGEYKSYGAYQAYTAA